MSIVEAATYQLNPSLRTDRRSFLTGLTAATAAICTQGIWGLGSSWADEGDPVAVKVPAPKLGKAKSVIFYFCAGGPSQAHTFTRPKEVELPDQHPFQFQRAGKSGLEISDIFPHLQTVADDLCIIRSGYGAKASHTDAGAYIFSGSNSLGASIGAWVLHGLGSGNPALPGHVALFGRVAGDTWTSSDGMLLGGTKPTGSGGLPPYLQAQIVRHLNKPVDDLQGPFTADGQKRWLEQLAQFNGMHAERNPGQPALEARNTSFQTAFRMQSAAPEAFDFSKEAAVASIRKRYGLDGLQTKSTGAKLLLARRLVERGVRFVLVPSPQVPLNDGGTTSWDTHRAVQTTGGMRNLAGTCDLPLAGLIADLKERGLFDSTLIVWGGEMGRGGKGFNNHNGNAFNWVMAGGGVKGGHAHGGMDERGYTSVEKPVHVRDLHATILALCGLDFKQLKYRGKGLDENCKIVNEIMV